MLFDDSGHFRLIVHRQEKDVRPCFCLRFRGGQQARQDESRKQRETRRAVVHILIGLFIGLSNKGVEAEAGITPGIEPL